MAEAFATSVASNLVSKLGEYLFAPIGRQFGYVLCYKSYVEDLENGVKELETARDRVQRSVNDAVNDGKRIVERVENWLKSVKEKTDEADKLFKLNESAKHACFRGWLPNPVVHHPIGRKVKKITKIIQGLLHEESQERCFQKVYHEDTPIGFVVANASSARSVDNEEDVLESRAKIMEDVLEAIVDGKVYVVGVWGEGGVGKSKLLEDVERRVREKIMFDVVAKVIISRTPDLKEIQRQIASALGLQLINDEVAPKRTHRLRNRLKDSKENILIILDDLWDKLDLKDVGIPCDNSNKVRGCKLLLTSRKRDVLYSMESDREFKLNVLEYGETRRLFESTVGDKVKNSDFKPWVDGVVKNCGGLPLSIVPLATMLKRKDLTIWMNASTNRDLSKVKSVVELSYKDIKEERIRSLFLVCALAFGRISTRDCLIYCMGLGLYQEFSKTIKAARCQSIANLHTLRDSSLLLDNNDRELSIANLHTLRDSSLLLDNNDRELFRMHDIFVEAAISIASTKWNALVWRKDYGFMSKDELRECTVISFPYVGIDELPATLDCPNLRMLLIFEHNQSLEIPESFFESIKKLQVLDLTGLYITTLPQSIEFLENLRSLSLDHCHLKDVTILGKLKGLQFLSFAGSTIARLPKAIGKLTKLRFLDLKGCFGLQIIEPGMLESLVNLEELYIDEFCQWEAEDEAPRSNASLTELKNMKKLSALCIIIPHSTNLSSDLPFGNLDEHKIRIGGTGKFWGEYKHSRILKLKLDSSNLLHEVWMQECLGRTQDLRLNGSQDGRDSIHDLCTKGFQELKHLHVKNNLSFHCVADSTKFPAFTRLESLVLNNLKNLEKICRDCLAPESFIQLKTLKVEYCSEIKYLFPSSMMKRFLQLEEIEITGCNLMQHIVANTKVEDNIDEVDNDANMKSYKLRRLTLQDLPKMTSFCKTEDHSVVFLDGQQVSLPWLETLTLSKLPKLKEIWNSQFPSNVSSIKFLKVEDCEFLLSIVPSNFLIKLHNLEAITVLRCRLIREVFDLEGLTASGDVEILSRLTRLILSELPSLERIWNKNPRRILCLGNLTTLKVQNCEKLRFFLSSSMAKALGQIKEIEIASCKLMEEVVDVQEEESEEIATTNNLEFPMLASLSLVELPNLKTFSYGNYYIHCPSLTKLTISGCPKMMTFSSFEGKQQSIQQVFGRVKPVFFNEKVSLPWLETLTLSELPKLKEIWSSQFLSNVSNLKFLKVEDCMFLLSIIPSNFLIKLQNLEAIIVERCQLIREVFDLEGLTASGAVEILSRLTELTLSELPSLECLWNKNPRRALCFRNLTTLKVQNCENLRSFFSSSMAKALRQIKEIEIASCILMEEVVNVQEEELEEATTTDTLEFPLLTSLSLMELPNLKTFSYGKYCISCPSLTKLMISGCPKMMTFSSFKGRQQSMRVGTSVQQAFGCIDSSLSSPSFFNEKVLFPSLVELKLSSMCQLKRIWHNKLHKQSFCKLASLTVGLCENLSHVFPSNSMDRLRSLSEIEVFGCLSLEALFESVSLSSEKRQKPLELSALKKLKLLNLPRLTDILKSDCEETLTFPSLMEVNVRRCHSLSYLFSSATAKTLHELIALDVSCCNNMWGIIVMKEGKGKTAEIFKFCHLTKLKLGDLKSLSCFSLENCAGDGLYPLFDEKLAFPKLEELHIEGVQQEELWNNKIPMESFCCLKVLKVKQCHNLMNVIPSFMSERLLHYMESLTVEECPRLRNLFTVFMAKNLGQLQYLSLGGCGEMEYIVAKQEEKPEESIDKIVIPQLVTMYLHNMPKLRSFCQDKHILEWPSLIEFTIEDCKAVKVILGDVSCRKLEGSGLTHQPFLLVEKVEFPAMELMKILHMDNMEKIWLDDLDSNAFGKLKSLVVEHCEKLLSIFSSYNMLTRFQNLEKITVTNCGSLEVAFEVQEFEFSEACSTNSFQLGKIFLTRLPKMKHVWNGLPRGGLTFGCLQCMEVVECKSLKSLFPSSVAKNMTQFKKLLVRDCGVEEIIVEKDGVGMSASDLFFPQLTDLRLLELPKLGSFYRNSHTSVWPFLKQLRVRQCGKIRSFLFACEFQDCQGTTTSENQFSLFSFEKVIPHLEGLTLAREDVAMIPQHYVFHNLKELSLACYHDENVAFLSNFLLHKFPNLEALAVIHSSFEEIFPEDSSGHGGVTPCGELTDMKKPLQALRSLNRLELYNLCNLKRLWKDGSLMIEILKQIEVLRVEECPRLPIVLPSPISFQRLAYLVVQDCSGLVHMGTCSAATSLVYLTSLSLRNCGAMEDVVTDDGNGAGDISFPKLVELILNGLPSLESFSNTNRALRFPSLVCIVITKCPKMNIFCKGALRIPELDEVLLSEEDDEGHWEGDLNTTIQTLSALNDPQ